MGLYSSAKFEASSIILTSFRQRWVGWGQQNVQWTSFKTVFIECFTDTPETRISKTRVEICNFIKKEPICR